MRMTKTAAALVVLGLMGTGCSEDWWYDSWYPEEPAGGAVDPTYTAQLSFEGGFFIAEYYGCFDMTVAEDQQAMADFGYGPSGLAATFGNTFWVWYGYGEFLGVASSATMNVHFMDGDSEVVVRPYYNEFGGAHGADWDSETDTYFDYVYTDNFMSVSSCNADLPDYFEYRFAAADLVDPTRVDSITLVQEMGGLL